MTNTTEKLLARRRDIPGLLALADYLEESGDLARAATARRQAQFMGLIRDAMRDHPYLRLGITKARRDSQYIRTEHFGSGQGPENAGIRLTVCARELWFRAGHMSAIAEEGDRSVSKYRNKVRSFYRRRKSWGPESAWKLARDIMRDLFGDCI